MGAALLKAAPLNLKKKKKEKKQNRISLGFLKVFVSDILSNFVSDGKTD